MERIIATYLHVQPHTFWATHDFHGYFSLEDLVYLGERIQLRSDVPSICKDMETLGSNKGNDEEVRKHVKYIKRYRAMHHCLILYSVIICLSSLQLMKAASACLLTDLWKCMYSEHFLREHLFNLIGSPPLINIFTTGYTRIVGTNLLVNLM